MIKGYLFTFANQQFNIMKLLNNEITPKRILPILILVMAFFESQANNYVQIKARNGDGLYTIFKKFGIAPTSCNINHFKELNKLKSVNKLLIGKQYQLPVVKINYNGKSILSSVPNINKTLATKISVYNKSIYQNKLRKSSYTKSRILWVVYGDVYCGPAAGNKATAIKASSKSISNIKTNKTIAISKPVTKPTNSAPGLATKARVPNQNIDEEISARIENNVLSNAEATSSGNDSFLYCFQNLHHPGNHDQCRNGQGLVFKHSKRPKSGCQAFRSPIYQRKGGSSFWHRYSQYV